MSELIQSGQHPDADQLSAFVEHALAPHEREQTLAHLATCTDCRAIVALSLPPLDEAPLPQPEPVRRPWFSGWILAWPAVAALAALAFFIVHLHNNASSNSGITTPTQIATTQPLPPLPAQTAPQVSAPKPVAPPSTAKSQPPDRGGASAAATASPASPVISAFNGQQIATAPIDGRNSSSLAQPQAARAAGTGSGQFHGAAGQPQVPTAMAAESARPNFFTAGNAPPPAPSISPVKTPSTATPSNLAEASRIKASATDATSAEADANASSTTLVTNGLAPVTAVSTATLSSTLRATANMPLPSRLPTLSTAANGNQMLAIDTQNSVFYSEDRGQHWSAISAPWRGRAVRVNLARPAISSDGAAYSLATSSVGVTGGPIAAAAGTASTTLTGTITDPAGAVIAGASVTISDAATKAGRTVQTDRNGRYLVDNLTPGSYQIEATAPGFSKQQLAAVTVAAAQQNQANLILSVGQATETVTVEASASVMPLAAPRALKKAATPAAPAPVSPAALFEITTDSGDRWTSSDGKTWTKK